MNRLTIIFLLVLCAFAHCEISDFRSQASNTGGLLVFLGRDETGLADELSARKNTVFQCLENPGATLPYADNLVNQIVVQGSGFKVQSSELMRVLVPGGRAYVRKGDEWDVLEKSWPEEIDKWTHFLHGADNNAVAKDEVVGPPKHMQWVAGPLYCRSHEFPSSVGVLVSAGGRIFYILDEGLTGITSEELPPRWVLIARDAFNGIQLWKKHLPGWGWRAWGMDLEGKDWTQISGLRHKAPQSITRRLVTSGDKVFVTLGHIAPLSILDASSGRILKTCKDTEGTDEILFHNGKVIIRICDFQNQSEDKRKSRPAPDTVAMVDSDTGSIVWKKEAGKIPTKNIAASDGDIVFLDKSKKELVSLDLETGDENWRTSIPKTFLRGGTLVIYEDTVLLRRGAMFAGFDLEKGQKLWEQQLEIDGNAVKKDLFVIDGLMWHPKQTPGLLEGREFWDLNRSPCTGLHVAGYDIRTGKERKSFDIENLLTPGHHIRCYQSKATERYIIWPKRAAEFIDLKGDNHMRNDWVRGPCVSGVMPCNGLLYVPPNQCFCYQGVNLRGFNVLAASETDGPELPPKSSERLTKGSAYGGISDLKFQISEKDWSQFRHDSHRTGSASCKVKPKVSENWKTELGGKLSQPIVVDGELYVARVDAHELVCLDAKNGKELWRYKVDSRIDSPPAFHKGLILFGSADGYVYCLRASDGELAWKFLVAPRDKRIVAFGQVESAWPSHGSVLTKDNVVYASAGRSSFVDGGIHVYGLDPVTGRALYYTCIEGPYPDYSKVESDPFDMQGTYTDLLSTDGEYIYMLQIMMDSKLNQIEAPEITRMGDRKFGMHVFSTAGFLDGSWFNRSFWMHTERWPGFYIANQAPKSGQLLVHDDNTTYAIKCYTTRNVNSPMFFPGNKGYLLFADDNENEPILQGEPGAPEPIQWLPKLTIKPYQYKGKARDVDYGGEAFEFDKGSGFTRAKPPKWAEWVPIRARGMVVADKTLFIAGPPDEIDPKDPLAAFEGRKGGFLRAVSAAKGKKLTEIKLDAPPVFDGLIAANGALYMSATDGTIRCFRP